MQLAPPAVAKLRLDNLFCGPAMLAMLIFRCHFYQLVFINIVYIDELYSNLWELSTV